MCVYDPLAYKERVNFAARYISEGRKTNRTFDTCFEMYDGDIVALELYRRAKKNGKLAINLGRYIDLGLREAIESRYAHVKTKDLHIEAEKLRRIAGAA